MVRWWVLVAWNFAVLCTCEGWCVVLQLAKSMTVKGLLTLFPMIINTLKEYSRIRMQGQFSEMSACNYLLCLKRQQIKLQVCPDLLQWHEHTVMQWVPAQWSKERKQQKIQRPSDSAGEISNHNNGQWWCNISTDWGSILGSRLWCKFKAPHLRGLVIIRYKPWSPMKTIQNTTGQSPNLEQIM
jgi:hypothetical protein